MSEWHKLITDPFSAAMMTISICSVLHTFLPPWDWNPPLIREGLADFPSAQKGFYAIFHNRYYKLLIYVVGYIALNGRSTMWKAISMKNQVIAAGAEPPVTSQKFTDEMAEKVEGTQEFTKSEQNDKVPPTSSSSATGG